MHTLKLSADIIAVTVIEFAVYDQIKKITHYPYL